LPETRKDTFGIAWIPPHNVSNKQFSFTKPVPLPPLFKLQFSLKNSVAFHLFDCIQTIDLLHIFMPN
jgi:hypothetical protein